MKRRMVFDVMLGRNGKTAYIRPASGAEAQDFLRRHMTSSWGAFAWTWEPRYYAYRAKYPDDFQNFILNAKDAGAELRNMELPKKAGK